MNSEELEQSLKAEFESHVNSVISEIKQEAAAFRAKVQEDLEHQRTRMDEAFEEFGRRFESKSDLGGGFAELVSEHLKLARDEGARLAATAYTEAEKIEDESVKTAEAPNFSSLRDAIADISSQDSQSSILKSLIDHAGKFASRGAFFIIKSEHFAGWRVFGDGSAEHAIREVHFPVSENTILAKASEAKESVHSSYGDYQADGVFLDRLGFGQPERMYAIPLVARGRGVAVLYADGGNGGAVPNVDALELLVRVAGMTVELLASAVAVPAQEHETAEHEAEAVESHHEAAPSPSTPAEEYQQYEPGSAPVEHREAPEYTFEAEPEAVTSYEDAGVEEHSFQPTSEAGFSSEGETPVFSATDDREEAAQTELEPEYRADEAPVHAQAEPEYRAEDAFAEPEPQYQAEEAPLHAQPESEYRAEDAFAEPEPQLEAEAEPQVEAEPEPEPEPAPQDLEEYQPSVTPAAFEPAMRVEEAPQPAAQSPFERAVTTYEPAAAPIGAGMGQRIEVATTPTSRGRLSDRPVDLPIEVPEEDRRMHNDARRFARLLVSEIKLYNEKKVLEGRQSHDLYDRLREAIDRSREMYDKRVQPPVAAKFDYFHYELVNSLAEGEAAKFGNAYPGPTV